MFRMSLQREKVCCGVYGLITPLYRLQTSCRYSVVMQVANQNKYLIPLSQSPS